MNINSLVVQSVPSAQEFRCFRNRFPLLFRHEFADRIDGDLTRGLSEDALSGAVDVLQSNDNRQFLKHELTYSLSLPLGKAVESILGDAHPRTDAKKSYLRVYQDAAPAAWVEATRPVLTTLQHLVSLAEDDSPHAFKPFKPANVGMWISSAGCETPLHFDLCHGFLHQVHGEKTFLLCHPRDAPYLYWDQRGSSASKNRTTSPVDLPRWLDGDAEQRHAFPHVDNCTFYEARLSPGLTLYTPPGWWHAVRSVSSSVSLLAPFDPRPDLEALPSNVLLA